MVPADPVALVNAARPKVAPRVGADLFEDVAERPPGDVEVSEVVPELRELVEDEVAGILR